jgi:hypothetical protein
MAKGGDWESRVPAAVAKYLKTKDGPSRVAAIFSTENY